MCSVQIVVNQKKGGKNAKNVKNLSGSKIAGEFELCYLLTISGS